MGWEGGTLDKEGIPSRGFQGRPWQREVLGSWRGDCLGGATPRALQLHQVDISIATPLSGNGGREGVGGGASSQDVGMSGRGVCPGRHEGGTRGGERGFTEDGSGLCSAPVAVHLKGGGGETAGSKSSKGPNSCAVNGVKHIIYSTQVSHVLKSHSMRRVAFRN